MLAAVFDRQTYIIYSAEMWCYDVADRLQYAVSYLVFRRRFCGNRRRFCSDSFVPSYVTRLKVLIICVIVYAG